MREVIYKLGSNGNLNPLNGIHYQNTQLAIKGIISPDQIKGGVCSERIAAFLSKRVKIGAQPIMTLPRQEPGVS